MVVTKAPYNPDPHAHPGLHVIASIEAIKGALALLAATGLEMFGPEPLRRAVDGLIQHFHLDPEHGALPTLFNAITPDAVHIAAVLAACYGVVHLIEAWGLWRAKAWASWLGCVTAAIYLPFDLYAIWRHPGWASLAVLAINLLIVVVLARDIAKRHRR
jgi:uncharacterized membrane protein (DUF2068 family)